MSEQAAASLVAPSRDMTPVLLKVAKGQIAFYERSPRRKKHLVFQSAPVAQCAEADTNTNFKIMIDLQAYYNGGMDYEEYFAIPPLRSLRTEIELTEIFIEDMQARTRACLAGELHFFF